MNDEQNLILQAQRDPAAFAALYKRYVDRIYAFAFHQLGDQAAAEDITSATFEKALQKLSSFRWQGISVGAWLYRIARNELYQHHRSQKKRLPLPDQQPSEQNVEQSVQYSEEQRVIRHAISRLDHADQELIILRFFENLSSPEVAEILGCSTSQLYVRLHRALKRLRQKLDPQESLERMMSYVSE